MRKTILFFILVLLVVPSSFAVSSLIISGGSSQGSFDGSAYVAKTTRINVTGPLFINNGANVNINEGFNLTIAQAGAVTGGFLTAMDWNTFNNKVGLAEVSGFYTNITNLQTDRTQLNLTKFNVSGGNITGSYTSTNANVYGNITVGQKIYVNGNSTFIGNVSIGQNVYNATLEVNDKTIRNNFTSTASVTTTTQQIYTFFINGSTGANNSAVSGSPRGGNGSSIFIQSGPGGSANWSTSANFGGYAGPVIIRGADGYNMTTYTGLTGQGTSGGDVVVEGGTGGPGRGKSNSRGGNGGSLYLRSGSAGPLWNGSVNGITGKIYIYGGAGANSFTPSLGSGTLGGSIEIVSGNGGTSQRAGGGAGGYLSIFSGSAGTGNITGNSGGTLSFLSGAGSSVSPNGTGLLNGGTGGQITLNGGSSADHLTAYGGNGGDTYFLGGDGGVGSSSYKYLNGTAGNVYISGGRYYNTSESVNVLFGKTILTCHPSYGCGGSLSIGFTGRATEKIQQDSGTAQATYHKFTAGTTTGQTVNDGFNIGISATGEAQIKQLENHNLTLYTNNIERIKINMTGDVIINNLTGTGNDYVCVSATGGLYRSDAGCA